MGKNPTDIFVPQIFHQICPNLRKLLNPRIPYTTTNTFFFFSLNTEKQTELTWLEGERRFGTERNGKKHRTKQNTSAFSNILSHMQGCKMTYSPENVGRTFSIDHAFQAHDSNTFLAHDYRLVISEALLQFKIIHCIHFPN
jgi:hypothetical protein